MYNVCVFVCVRDTLTCMYVLVIAGVVVIYGSYSCETESVARGQGIVCICIYVHVRMYVFVCMFFPW